MGLFKIRRGSNVKSKPPVDDIAAVRPSLRRPAQPAATSPSQAPFSLAKTAQLRVDVGPAPLSPEASVPVVPFAGVGARLPDTPVPSGRSDSSYAEFPIHLRAPLVSCDGSLELKTSLDSPLKHMQRSTSPLTTGADPQADTCMPCASDLGAVVAAKNVDGDIRNVGEQQACLAQLELLEQTPAGRVSRATSAQESTVPADVASAGCNAQRNAQLAQAVRQLVAQSIEEGRELPEMQMLVREHGMGMVIGNEHMLHEISHAIGAWDNAARTSWDEFMGSGALTTSQRKLLASATREMREAKKAWTAHKKDLVEERESFAREVQSLAAAVSRSATHASAVRLASVTNGDKLVHDLNTGDSNLTTAVPSNQDEVRSAVSVPEVELQRQRQRQDIQVAGRLRSNEFARADDVDAACDTPTLPLGSQAEAVPREEATSARDSDKTASAKGGDQAASAKHSDRAASPDGSVVRTPVVQVTDLGFGDYAREASAAFSEQSYPAPTASPATEIKEQGVQASLVYSVEAKIRRQSPQPNPGLTAAPLVTLPATPFAAPPAAPCAVPSSAPHATPPAANSSCTQSLSMPSDQHSFQTQPHPHLQHELKTPQQLQPQMAALATSLSHPQLVRKYAAAAAAAYLVRQHAAADKAGGVPTATDTEAARAHAHQIVSQISTYGRGAPPSSFVGYNRLASPFDSHMSYGTRRSHTATPLLRSVQDLNICMPHSGSATTCASSQPAARSGRTVTLPTTYAWGHRGNHQPPLIAPTASWAGNVH
mmetsp:Transcript_62377/g.103754  ORF Transcript_62377/g.103754 Transcript_62377/m.103754 type:complete len:768 (+) Transcript_62377:51-2354(+)